jgi:hypothetical protein
MTASGKFADEGNDLALSLLLHIGTPTAPTTLYVGLATAAVTETSTLATITEVSDGAYYARQAVTFSTPGDVGGKRTVHNTGDLTFGTFNTGGIAVTHAFLTNVASGTSGKVIACCDLGTTKYTNTGETLVIPATTGFVASLD